MKQRNGWFFAAMFGVTPALAGGPDVQVGEWETTVKTEMSGMPMAIPPMTHRHCLREEDLVPKTQDPSQDCKLLEHNIDGNTVTWRIECEAQGTKTSGTGKIVYAGDTYKGQIDMTMQQAGAPPMNMTQTLEGRRIGECK